VYADKKNEPPVEEIQMEMDEEMEKAAKLI